jgi:hypothetical protein
MDWSGPHIILPLATLKILLDWLARTGCQKVFRVLTGLVLLVALFAVAFWSVLTFQFSAKHVARLQVSMSLGMSS